MFKERGDKMKNVSPKLEFTKKEAKGKAGDEKYKN